MNQASAADVAPGARDRALAGFVRAHTRPTRPHGLPEIVLALAADDAIEVWAATEDDQRIDGASPPFWAFAWPGGVGLARYCLDHPQLVAGRRVLDVATGSGVAAIAAARCGAAHVDAIDVDPLAVVAARANAARNGVVVDVMQAGVNEIATGQLTVGPGDVVLAGDVFYESHMAEQMLSSLQAARRRGARVLVGDPRRSRLPTASLRELTEIELEVDAELEGRRIADVVIAELVG